MKRFTFLLVALVLYGCATTSSIDQGRALIAEGRFEEGLGVLEEAAKARYSNPETYSVWVTQRDNVVRTLVREGDMHRNVGRLDAAETAYARALQIDASAAIARNGLDAVARTHRHLERVQQAEEAFQRGDLATAEQITRAVLAEDAGMRRARTLMMQISERRGSAELEPPKLGAALQKPLTLEFRNAPLRSVFEVISRTSGINFVFDRDVRPDLRTTIFVRDASLDDIVKLLLVTNQLDRKVLNDNSVLIFPNTPAKQKDYQDLVVRSFYLTNADAKQTAAMIRALVKTRDLFIDDKLNLVVMKDTREAVRLAEQLVATQDLGEPEVMLELEVLEVASSRLKEVGIRYPDQINFGILGNVTGGTDNGGTSNIPDLIELKPRQWEYFVANPAMILNLRQTDGVVNTLANPRIRVKNREKARIHIGEKVPVITTTSTANVGVSSSVNYLEVGLKLDVEPNVYLDDEVAIKLQLEVSNILEQLNVSGTVSYRLGTRNAATTLRLRDGETQVLAGLINDEDRRSANKVPYLSDFPILGRLFRSDNDQRVKTEIVLLITPRVVRNLARPQTVQAHFPSGTEAAPGAAPLRIASTRLGSMKLESAGGGARPSAQSPANRARASDDAASDTGLALVVTGPAEASIGSTFSMSLGMPARNEGSRTALRISYDPGVLQLVSGASTESPGVARLQLTGPSVVGSPMTVVQTQFRVVAKEPTTAQISIESAGSTNSQGQPISIDIPGSYSVSILPGTPGQSVAPGATAPAEPPAAGDSTPSSGEVDSATPSTDTPPTPSPGDGANPPTSGEPAAPTATPPTPTPPPPPKPTGNPYDSEG
jgi:general secretion pathway protein D